MSKRVLVFANKMIIEAGSLYMQVFVPEFNEIQNLSITSVPTEILRRKRFNNKLFFTASFDVEVGKIRLRNLKNLQLKHQAH